MGALIFGLTGGIGSGKSTVAAHFRQRGVDVVDADQLAREAVAPGSAALDAIVAEFGPEMQLPDGHLNRPALAARVFGDDAARKTLNQLVHPRVRELARARFQELEARGVPLICYEIPLLYETHQAENYRPVVVVESSEATQLRRAMQRDGASEAEVLARIRAQLPLREKAARADYVIHNDGPKPQTYAQADAVLRSLCDIAGVEPARYGL